MTLLTEDQIAEIRKRAEESRLERTIMECLQESIDVKKIIADRDELMKRLEIAEEKAARYDDLWK